MQEAQSSECQEPLMQHPDDECSSTLKETSFSRDCLNENNVIAQIAWAECVCTKGEGERQAAVIFLVVGGVWWIIDHSFLPSDEFTNSLSATLLQVSGSLLNQQRNPKSPREYLLSEVPFKAPTEKLNVKSKKMILKCPSPLLCALMLYLIGTVPQPNTEFMVPAICNKRRGSR